MTYQRALVKEHARQAIKGKKPCRRALGYLLLGLLLSLTAALPLLGIRFFAAPAEGGVNNAPALWSCWLFALVLPSAAQALLYTGGCAYCLDLWRGRGVTSRRFFAGFSRFPRVAALGLLITLFSFLWGLPYILLLLLSIFLMWFSALPLSFFPFLPLSPDNLVSLSNLVRPTPASTALVCILALLFLALCLNRTLRYTLSYFVLLDQPQLTAAECLEESKALMKGRKWQLVVLMLSFLGWSLLTGLLHLGIQLLYPALLSLFPTAALPGVAFWCLRILMILYLIVLVVSAVLLPLWLINYAGVSLAGFYDYAQADRSNQPAPPRSWQVYS